MVSIVLLFDGDCGDCVVVLNDYFYRNCRLEKRLPMRMYLLARTTQ